MQIQSFQYIKNRGWSVDNFPNLDSENTLVIVFSSPFFLNYPVPLRQLADIYKKSKIIGCSTAGEIFGSRILDDSLAVAVVKFDKTPLRLCTAKVSKPSESYKAGELIANELQSKDLRSIFVLSDGLTVNGTALVKGLNDNTKEGLIITGGLAADGSHFNNTWTLCNGEIIDNYVVAVGFYGNYIQVGHASKGGWDIFGPARRITRSEGNILYELDNQPALHLYKEYLGDRAAELPASGLLYPLAIKDGNTKNPVQLVRTILGVDEKTQSLIFAGDMPMGYQAQLMRANFDRLITSANEAGELARNRLYGDDEAINSPVLAIAVSCVGRRLLLGERTEEETESTLEALPPLTTQIGFYSYGELSPFNLGSCELHNQTMTLTTYFERNEDT
ncbi:FIST signal transduction protein [Legionella quinlivanii]|uniref:FIST signal transduction protein n=1 Tax=Legionella quinlivanii TaxID=45073 RepID=UPI002244409B|nr:FIST N-terminal domain-containing protein [Legionella quinlivanii]MCW8450604.1 FIST C-terminal domain-containing protein [Legionella quinlivanii]